VDVLEPGPFQPRADIEPKALDELVASIEARGVLQPLLVRPHPDARGRYQIIAGERRWRAAQRAGLHEVPVLVRAFDDREAMAAALVENLQRQDLDPVEEAEGFRRLIEEFGLTQEALAQQIGKSRSHVANTMRLLNLPMPVLAELRRGNLTPGHARALLAHPDPARAAMAVIARGLNVRQTEALAAGRAPLEATQPEDRPGPDRRKNGRGTDADTAALERDLSERLGLRVDINFDGQGGSVRIRYRGLDQLDGLIALLSRD
jgi:ParB family chromosome partitioning protein